MTLTLEELAAQLSQALARDPPSIPAPAVARREGEGEVMIPVGHGVQVVDFARHGYHLDATVLPQDLVPAAAWLDRVGFALDTITGVDWIHAGEMELVYDYFHPIAGWRVVIRARVARSEPEVPTLSEIFPGANWHERETHDFFGIRFRGHPDLAPFLLPEDADYHPLRKDYAG